MSEKKVVKNIKSCNWFRTKASTLSQVYRTAAITATILTVKYPAFMDTYPGNTNASFRNCGWTAPTPAVAGVARNVACGEFVAYENFERVVRCTAWFGWTAEVTASLLIGIRSALIDGDRASLYAEQVSLWFRSRPRTCNQQASGTS